MRRCLIGLMAAAGIVFGAGMATAFEFQPLGYESMSMGGAGVASARGPFAVYYNPALLARQKHGMQIAVSAGIGVREVNLADNIDALASIDVEHTIDRVIDEARRLDVSEQGVPADLPQSVRKDIIAINNRLKNLAVRGSGLELMPSFSAGCQVGRFGFGAFGVAGAAAYGVIDPDRLDMIVRVPNDNEDIFAEYRVATNEVILTDEAEYESRSLAYALENGRTYLQIHGVTYFEIPIAYGHRFPTATGNLDVGGSFKIMPGMVYNQRIDIDTASGDVGDELSDYGQDTTWGIDLGLAYTMERVPGVTLGLVGKNLNTPKFKYRGRDFDVDPLVRAGAAWDLLGDKLTIALDLDITQNDTMIPGYSSRFFGGGVNLAPTSWLSARAGLMQNLHSNVEGMVYTAGLGFGLKWLQFDLAGQYSSQQGRFDNQKFPRYSRIQFALVSKWF